MEEVPPSLTKNLTGGAGCGCGCLGLLMALAGGLVLGAIPLGMYADPSAAPMGAGIAVVVTGLVVSALGIVVWLVSLFLD